jgi:hypothetical protein
MIPVLSLVVAMLAVFFGPLVAWTVARQQIAVNAREMWLRELREQVALFMAHQNAIRFYCQNPAEARGLEEEKRASERLDALFVPYSAISLLLAEKGLLASQEYQTFIGKLNRSMTWKDAEESYRYLQEIINTAARFMTHQRAALASGPGIWRAIRVSLGWTKPA